MKRFMLVLALLFAPLMVPAQDELPDQAIAVGVGINQYSTPQIQGWGTYAHKIAGPLYVLSTYDVTAIPNTQDQLLGVLPQLQFSFRPGIAIPFKNFGRLSLWGLGEAGLATTGSTTGGSFGAGGFALWRFQSTRKSGWAVLCIMRVVKNNITGVRYIPEVGIAYGVNNGSR